MYIKILKQHTCYEVELYLSNAQFKFRKVCFYTDSIFFFRKLGLLAIRYNKDLLLVVIDQGKVFNCVKSRIFWMSMV